MRTISLLPAGTEMIAALGALEHLVGVTHECDYPTVVRSRARVTRTALPAPRSSAAETDAAVRGQTARGEPLFALHAKTIAALRPDLILTQALCDVCAVREADVRALAATLEPSPRIVTLGGVTLDGVFADLAAVADALGLTDEREELTAGLRARLRQVHRVLEEARAPRPRVAMLEWTDPVYVAGHWVPEMVRAAGGADVLGAVGARSTQRAIADVEAADPETVIVAPCGYPLDDAFAAAESICAHPEWRWLEGRDVWAIDANGLVSRPGPRLVEGIEAIARMLHPHLFSPLDPAHGRRVR